jgi:DNA-binding NarL/FixJ family response regulator
VLEAMRNDPLLRSVPVVVLTMSRDAPDIHRAYVLGANSYIVKPVTFERFVDIAKAIDIYWCIVPERKANPTT